MCGGGGGVTHPFLSFTDHEDYNYNVACDPCRLMPGHELYPPSPRVFHYIDFLTCTYIIIGYAEFVVLHFRLYVVSG